MSGATAGASRRVRARRRVQALAEDRDPVLQSAGEVGHDGTAVGLQIMVRVLRKQVSGRGWRRRARPPDYHRVRTPAPYSCHPTGWKWIADSLVVILARRRLRRRRFLAARRTRRRDSDDTGIGPPAIERRRARARSRTATRAAGNAPAPNPQGRIPVLEYHVIGGDKNTLYTRTAASYQADLEEAYKLGYRPITIAQMLDKNFARRAGGDVAGGVRVRRRVATRSSATSSRTASSTIDPTSARRHLAGFREDASGLEEPRGVLHAERRRGGPQLLRRQPEVRTARRRSGASRR